MVKHSIPNSYRCNRSSVAIVSKNMKRYLDGLIGTYELSNVSLLREVLFPFDAADLNFGIYRILNFKRDQIKKLIEQDIREIVDQANCPKCWLSVFLSQRPRSSQSFGVLFSAPSACSARGFF